MAKDINSEIEDMASRLEKASEDPKEKLINVIKSLGSQGLKERLATLNEEEKLMIKAALEEMSLQKAISFDKEASGAKMIQGKVVDTIIQEEVANDDADEKLVKPEAAKHDHQGTPTDGWQGQVIKSEEEKAEDEKKKKAKQKEEKDMKKSEQDLFNEVMKSDEAFQGLVEKMLLKADEKLVAKKLKEKGADDKKVQGAIDKFKGKKKDSDEDDVEKAKILKEEDQLGDAPEMNEKTMGKKSAAPDVENVPKASKNAQKEVKKADDEDAKDKLMEMEEKEHGTKDPKKLVAAEKKEHKMKKSISWDDDTRLLKANTQGRNFNFNLEQFIDENQVEKSEDIVKSETPKEDLNDLIEKSLDRNWDQVNHERSTVANAKKQSGTLVKSFDEVTDLAASMGMSEEEAKKIMGIK